MLTTTDPSLESYLKRLPSADIFDKLLASKQYDQIEQILHSTLVMMPPSTPKFFIEILVAARQIAMACSVCSDQAEWHKWASEEARQHEYELTQTLHVLSDLFNQSDVPKLERYSSQLNVDVADSKLNLWQRLQSWLGFEAENSATQTSSPPLIDVVTTPNFPHIYQPSAPQSVSHTPSLIIYGLGSFRVYQNGSAIENWPSRKGKSIFRYLILNRKKLVPKEVLMDCFWMDADADAARNNLNVTIYNLRQTLRKLDPTCSHILFQDDSYMINPDFEIWVDFEAFSENFKKAEEFKHRGNEEQAINYYMIAEPLYQGELFAEDRYDEWVIPHREVLQENYLTVLKCLNDYFFKQQNYTACIGLCNKMVAVDPSCEDAHRRLMGCYLQLGQRYLALRQYHTYAEALKRELDIVPSLALTDYYQEILGNRAK